MKRLFGILKEKKGSSHILAIVITLVVLMISAAAFEYMRLMIIASGVRDAFEKAITVVATENTDEVYRSVREGFSGGYNPDESFSWKVDVDHGNVYNYITDLFNMTENGVYYEKGNEFRLSELDVQVRNTPFAPNGSHEELEVIGNITLEVPLTGQWTSLPPMKIKLRASSGYTLKVK